MVLYARTIRKRTKGDIFRGSPFCLVGNKVKVKGRQREKKRIEIKATLMRVWRVLLRPNERELKFYLCCGELAALIPTIQEK